MRLGRAGAEGFHAGNRPLRPGAARLPEWRGRREVRAGEAAGYFALAGAGYPTWFFRHTKIIVIEKLDFSGTWNIFTPILLQAVCFPEVCFHRGLVAELAKDSIMMAHVQNDSARVRDEHNVVVDTTSEH